MSPFPRHDIQHMAHLYIYLYRRAICALFDFALNRQSRDDVKFRRCSPSVTRSRCKWRRERPGAGRCWRHVVLDEGSARDLQDDDGQRSRGVGRGRATRSAASAFLPQTHRHVETRLEAELEFLNRTK